MALLRCIALLMLLPSALWAKTFPFQLDSAGNKQVEVELDAYYSSTDYIFSISNEAIPQVDPTQETGVYSYLFFNMLNPQYALFEVSVNPLPLLGTVFHENAPHAYRKADIGSDQVNAITALTAGFPEPWAFSFFLGNVVDFVNAGDTTKTVNGKGYGGALLSVGNYHILSNTLIKDYWAEGELKLKGSTISPAHRMSWSFRIGGKVHSHEDIYDILYFSVKRDRVDLKEPLDFNLLNLILRNSEIEARTDIRIPRDVKVWNYFTKLYLLGGKKWPSKSGTWAFSLSLGCELTLQPAYRGALAANMADHDWALIVRPNIVF